MGGFDLFVFLFLEGVGENDTPTQYASITLFKSDTVLDISCVSISRLFEATASEPVQIH